MNRIICPLVGFKLAALRSFRKSNQSYKEIREIHRKITTPALDTCGSDAVTRRRSGSFGSALRQPKDRESSCSWGPAKKSVQSMERDIQSLEGDVYRKLEDSEKEYITKSLKEVLSYIPISERIVARMQNSSANSQDSDILEPLSGDRFREIPSKKGNDQLAKTTDFGSFRNRTNLGNTFNQLPELSIVSQSSKGKTRSDNLPTGCNFYELGKLAHRRQSLASNFKITANDQPSTFRPGPTFVDDSKSITYGRSRNLQNVESMRTAMPSSSEGSGINQKIHFEELPLSSDSASSLSSLSCSNSVFVNDSSSTLSSRESKASEEDNFSSFENQFDHSASKVSINSNDSYSNDNFNKVANKFTGKNGASRGLKLSQADIKNIMPYYDWQYNLQKVKLKVGRITSSSTDCTDSSSSVSAISCITETFLLNSTVLNSIWEVFSSAIDITKLSHATVKNVSIAFEIWTINWFLEKNLPYKGPGGGTFSKDFHQRLVDRTIAVGVYLQEKLPNISQKLSVLDIVETILVQTGFGGDMASTFHSFSLTEDVIHIWNSLIIDFAEFAPLAKNDFCSFFKTLDAESLAVFVIKILDCVKMKETASHNCNSSKRSRSHSISSTSTDDSTVWGGLGNEQTRDTASVNKKLACFPCNMKQFFRNRCHVKENLSQYVNSLYTLQGRIELILKNILPNGLHGLHMLDFFFDNRHVIVGDFIKRNSSQMKNSSNKRKMSQDIW